MNARADIEPLMAINDLSLSIDGTEGEVKVLDHINLRLLPGDIMGLVGESGCGKSTLVKAVLRILPKAARITTGDIVFEGRNLAAMSSRTLSSDIRARKIGFIPQDPYLALNPVFTIGAQLLEIMKWHGARPGPGSNRALARARVVDLFRKVRLPDPEAMLSRYPHQLSGGQRQRVLIAAALLCEPSLVVADEPTTALDVTTQQQILCLLRDLAEEMALSILFVTHDFGVVSELCKSVTVMYAGQTVETGTMAEVVFSPLHPYTKRLIDCHPDRLATLEGIPGIVPSLIDPPGGCRFHPRCSEGTGGCPRRAPILVTQSPGRAVNCIHFDDVPA